MRFRFGRGERRCRDKKTGTGLSPVDTHTGNATRFETKGGKHGDCVRGLFSGENRF